MVKECSSCGAPSTEAGIGASWACQFCGSTNYDEAYVEAYLSNIDVAKLSNYMRLAKNSYEAGKFEDAAAKFDRALAEDAENAEAWAYKGLALAHTIHLSNIDAIPREVDLCFKQASSLQSEGDEFLSAAHAVARERVVAELLRAAVREVEQAEKSAFAFSHDPAQARRRASGRYDNAFGALAACLSGPSENVRQMLDVCRLTLAASYEKYASPSANLKQAALDYVEDARTRFPDLSIEMPAPRSAVAACFPGSALIAVGRNRQIRVDALESGATVAGYDRRTRAWAPVEIRTVRRWPAVRVLELVLDDDSVVSTTRSHSFLTAFGWRAAGRLSPGDRCLCAAPAGPEVWRTVRDVRVTGRVESVYSFVTSHRHVTSVHGCLVHDFTWLRGFRALMRSAIAEPLRSALRPDGARVLSRP